MHRIMNVVKKVSTISPILVLTLGLMPFAAAAGVTSNNGWYNGEQIYYVDQGVEKKTDREHLSDIFLIGGPRVYQANVVEEPLRELGLSENTLTLHLRPCEIMTIRLVPEDI